ncbi:hypothetical protein [Nocardia sp. NPDC051570]|uniref:hypothetical protein n=1 Tax=Nocardia sp. NPDC051570 TaxID=3364324 RepID=UPI0037ADAFFF
MDRDPSKTTPFERVCYRANETLALCEGYFIHRIAFDIIEGNDALEILLRHSPHKPDITISLEGIHHLSIDKFPESSGSFLDKVSVVHLPAPPAPWPDEFATLRRQPGLPELAWIQLIGPTQIEIIASIVTVFTALSDDAARAKPTP